MWCADFDPRVRRVVNLMPTVDSQLCVALRAADCMTVEAVKELSSTSACLEGLTDAERGQFLEAVRAIDDLGTFE